MNKRLDDSIIKMTELVLPQHTNLLGNLLGGQLMHWMDIAGALACTKFSRCTVATVLTENITFKHPIQQGSIVDITAKIIFTGKTSMVVHLIVEAENPLTNDVIITNEALFTFVAVKDGRATLINHQVSFTDFDCIKEKNLYNEEKRKYEERLDKK